MITPSGICVGEPFTDASPRAGFTPGPWKAAGRTVIESGCGDAVAMVNLARSPARASADACLISAAPDLLAALQALFALVEDGTLVRDISHDAKRFAPRALPLVIALQKAQLAIDKATQSSPVLHATATPDGAPIK